jgi:hypothetical protein
MNENEAIKFLQAIELPEIELPAGKQKLKTALLAAAHPKRCIPAKWFIPAGLTSAAATLVVIVSVTILGTGSPQALAQETVRRMIIQLGKLSPAERTEMENRWQANLDIFTDALAADDLAILTPEQVEQFEREVLLPMNEALAAAGRETRMGDSEQAPAPAAPRVATYLHYTDATGQCITFGVDENNLPVMVMRLCLGDRPNFDQPHSAIIE